MRVQLRNVTGNASLPLIYLCMHARMNGTLRGEHSGHYTMVQEERLARHMDDSFVLWTKQRESLFSFYATLRNNNLTPPARTLPIHLHHLTWIVGWVGGSQDAKYSSNPWKTLLFFRNQQSIHLSVRRRTKNTFTSISLLLASSRVAS